MDRWIFRTAHRIASRLGVRGVPHMLLEGALQAGWTWKFQLEVLYAVGGLENDVIFPFSWECHHPNWRTHIFLRGRYTTNQKTW